jgi:hypothetical protein
MRNIGAPLKTYGRIVALFKDVITDQEPITTTFRQRYTAINHFFDRFSMKGLYPTVLTQPSPLNNRFYPVPVHNAQAMIESLLYSSLAKDDNNLRFPNPDDPLAPPPSVVQNIADINTGDVYQTAYKNLCTRPNPVDCHDICSVWSAHLWLRCLTTGFWINSFISWIVRIVLAVIFNKVFRSVIDPGMIIGAISWI